MKTLAFCCTVKCLNMQYTKSQALQAIQHTACIGIRPSAHLCKVNAAHAGAAQDDLRQLLIAVPLRSISNSHPSSACCAGQTATHEGAYTFGKQYHPVWERSQLLLITRLDDKTVLENDDWQPRDEGVEGLAREVSIAVHVEVDLQVALVRCQEVLRNGTARSPCCGMQAAHAAKKPSRPAMPHCLAA